MDTKLFGSKHMGGMVYIYRQTGFCFVGFLITGHLF